MYGLIGKMRVAPGRRDLVVSALLDGVRSLPGCLSYIVAHDPSDPDAIWITEAWDSKDSHRASLQLPAVQQAISLARTAPQPQTKVRSCPYPIHGSAATRTSATSAGGAGS